MSLRPFMVLAPLGGLLARCGNHRRSPVLSPFRDWLAASGRRSRLRRTGKSTRARPAPQSTLNRVKTPARLNAEAMPLRAQAENISDQVASVAWAENQVGHRGVGRLEEDIQVVR